MWGTNNSRRDSNGCEESCEEARQEEGQGTDEDDQASGEFGSVCTDRGSCSHVVADGAKGKYCPKSRCSLAVSNRVAALGGGRILCGRALCRQGSNRRDSALEVVPRLTYRRTPAFYQSVDSEAGPLFPKIFLLCAAV